MRTSWKISLWRIRRQKSIHNSNRSEQLHQSEMIISFQECSLGYILRLFLCCNFFRSIFLYTAKELVTISYSLIKYTPRVMIFKRKRIYRRNIIILNSRRHFIKCLRHHKLIGSAFYSTIFQRSNISHILHIPIAAIKIFQSRTAVNHHIVQIRLFDRNYLQIVT